ncbi:hypothetical protein ACOMHN_034341 [Nucella lapillus]
MDVSRRLRKQRERSSLHARQLNKNAMALLHKQVHILERRQQENTRAFTRSRQALLQELNESPEPEHEGNVPGNRGNPRPGVSLLLQKGFEQAQMTPRSSSSEQRVFRDFRGDSYGEFTCGYSPSSSTGTLHLPLSFSRHHDDRAAHKCRFQASHLHPCPYFPCKRPDSYHRLKVSDVPDIAPLRMELDKIQPKSLNPNSASSPPTPDPLSIFSIAPGTSDGKTTRSSTSSARERCQADDHASPRTSVHERLRGLRQLVRELRMKNEEKRPRDWAVNYGDPMSRRLLRKPVIPVSDD